MLKIKKPSHQKPSCQIWTDASLHEEFQQIGCAAYIKEEGKEPYILIGRYLRQVYSNSNTAELRAIAMAVKYVDEAAVVQLFTDSKTARDMVSAIQKSKEKKKHNKKTREIFETLKNIPDECVDVISEHDSLAVLWKSRSNPKISIADKAAGLAREMTNNGLLQFFRGNGLELKIVS